MKILGLDLGTNSLGWAVVEINNGNTNLLYKGVRIFQEGVKIEKGIEGSKAAERTDFRSARRNKYRRKLRKIRTLIALSEYGYCPKLSNEELKNWRYKRVYPANKEFREWWKTDDMVEKNPYAYRNLAVTRRLDLNREQDRFIIGRAFYHMAQRRGFLSNRLEGTKESEGAVKQEIEEVSKAKEDRTLGQYFYEKYKRGEKIRDTYTHREEHYLEEFKRICEYQNIPTDFADKVERAIFYQRPLKSQKGLVGKCVFETNRPRCSVSRPEFEEYRMLSFMNNIKIKTPEDEKLRFLNESEKSKILPQFFRKSKGNFDFEDIAKLLAPKGRYKFYKDRNATPQGWLFNYSLHTNVSGCPVSSCFKNLFGDGFMDVEFKYIREKDGKESVIDINDIWHVLSTFDSDEKLREFAQKRLGFDESQTKQFLAIHLKKDYASLSLKAIGKILPYLRDGLIYSHAVFLANMESVIPDEIWNNEENRRIIRDEILNLIKTQNEEKQIVEIVNGIIKKGREENETWSEEAAPLYQKELIEKIISFYGKKYDLFSEDKRTRIEENAFTLLKTQMQKNMGRGEFAKIRPLYDRVKDFLADNFEIEEDKLEKIYHPSAIEVYKPPIKKEDGRFYLGSPMVSSIRNPMAMRALHQLRKVINELIAKDMIDSATHVQIEMARDLMNANERKAYHQWQHERENKRKEYASKIKENFGDGYEPSDTEILKYQLWEEQGHKCIYTGNEIGLTEFLGSNPKYDIEHTIPRSLSFDDSQQNKTLCENHFNRSVKRNKIPSELLSNFEQIIERIEPWKEKYEELDRQIGKAIRQSTNALDKEAKDVAIQKRHRLAFERDYWKNKYKRFVMENVPEGFKNSQLVDTGIITKYSRLYLRTLFDKVYTVKGSVVADFRKMWGLQDEYGKKARVNHIHHCIDAITMACITKESYELMAKFYHDWEDLHIRGVDHLPPVDKPWETFAEDVKNIENEVLVSHYTPDVLSKQSKVKLRKRGKIQYNKLGEPIYQTGDTVRGSLHQATFYGAIERREQNKKGEFETRIKYVVRKPLDSLKKSDVEKIVDDRVREIVKQAKVKEDELKEQLETLKKQLSRAEEEDEPALESQINELNKEIENLYVLPNKNGEPIPIKKVRVFQPTVTNPLHIKPQRDKSEKSSKPYKEDYHVANDGNYLMAIYEGINDKGKIKRDFEIVNNLEAADFFKYSVQKILTKQDLSHTENLIPVSKFSGKTELKLKGIVKTGTMVIFWKDRPEEIWDLDNDSLIKRLYKVTKLNKDGRITFKYHQEARNDEKLKVDYEEAYGVKPPKSLTNGESSVDFESSVPKLLLSPSNFNLLIEKIDFQLSPLGEISRIN